MSNDESTRSKPSDGHGGDGVDQTATDADAGRTNTPVTEEAKRLEGPTETQPEIQRVRAELAQLKDRVLRERAEAENVKKRVARDKADALRFANEGLIKDLLPVLDNLQRALEHARTSRDVDPIIEGVELVLRSFNDALERHGVQEVAARGVPFDPTHHEAISHVESDQPPNTVIDEHQRGYLLHGRLLRPSLVTVGKGNRRDRPDVEKEGDDG